MRWVWQSESPRFATPSPVAAQADSEFYRGKTVTYIVATAPGGGYDFYAASLNTWNAISRIEIRGQNMPGAGHVIGLNAVYAAARWFDAGHLQHQPDLQTTGRQRPIKADSPKCRGSARRLQTRVSSSQPVRRSRPSPISKSATVNFASGGLGGGGYLESKVLIDVLQLPVKLLAGYNGNDDQLAMRRGEITGIISSRSSSDDFVKNGYGRYIA
jgi:hypothetical protein